MWNTNSAGGRLFLCVLPQGWGAAPSWSLSAAPPYRTVSLPEPAACPECSYQFHKPLGCQMLRKCQYNSQCSFSTLNFEADTLLRTQILSPRLEDTPDIYKLSLLPGTLEDILYTAGGRSLIAWHWDWTLDKQGTTAFWPSLHLTHAMRTEFTQSREYSWLEISCLKVPDTVNYTELNFLTLEGWKAESALLGFKALRCPDIWNLSYVHQSRRGRSILDCFLIYALFSSEPKLSCRLFKNKKKILLQESIFWYSKSEFCGDPSDITYTHKYDHTKLMEGFILHTFSSFLIDMK